MKSDLSAAQIASYRENGFVVIPGFLDAGELAAWREAVDDAVGGRGQLRASTDPNSGGAPPPEDYYGNVFIQSLNLWKSNDKVRKLMIDPRLGKMATELAGVDGIRIWHDQALIKRPWDNPTSWHLDNPYWSFTSPDSLSIWVALDDATLQNGCLYFLPGTHKNATGVNPGIGANMNAIFKTYPLWAKIDSVAAPMKAGDCSFHNGLLAHGAAANMTKGWRRAMTCAYMPDGCTFNGQQNILTREQMARLKVGDVLDWNDQNPLLYSKSRPELMVRE
ncbi:MAG: phytanoyl-CoA dioxygenase family protein [Planctomycetota bacterium]|nr:phytanoyl-CoA dioxygenase family protein [Planctomycetota bacterium]